MLMKRKITLVQLCVLGFNNYVSEFEKGVTSHIY